MRIPPERFFKIVLVLPNFLYLLEEPLVMAHQMYFTKQAYPDLDSQTLGYFDQPLAHRYYAILEQYYETGAPIDNAFIVQCARIHKEPLMRLKAFAHTMYVRCIEMYQKISTYMKKL